MTKRAEISAEDLHAFIDGELDNAALAKVGAAVTGDPALAETAALYRADKDRIAAIYGGGLHDPLPRRWIDLIEGNTRKRRWSSAGLSGLAIAASVMLVFGLTLAIRQSAPAKSDIVTEALAARSNEMEPRNIMSVSSVAQVQAQNSAMARALATHVKVPDLSRMGYRLVGIEAYDSPARSFELVYRDRAERMFTLYFRRSSVVGTDLFVRKGLRVCVWQDDVLGMVMVGQVSAPEMLRLASAAYDGLTL